MIRQSAALLTCRTILWPRPSTYSPILQVHELVLHELPKWSVTTSGCITVGLQKSLQSYEISHAGYSAGNRQKAPHLSMVKWNVPSDHEAFYFLYSNIFPSCCAKNEKNLWDSELAHSR